MCYLRKKLSKFLFHIHLTVSLIELQFTFKVLASKTKRTWAIILSADKEKHFALFVYDMVFKPWETFFPRWIKSSLSLSALINLTAFLFTGTFSFGRFPLLTWWRLIICQKSLHLYNCFKCEVIVWGDMQGITTLVGRRLGKTLTIKCRVWDLAMFTIDTQDKKRSQKMIGLCLLYW